MSSNGYKLKYCKTMNIIKTVLSLFFSLVSVVVFADGYKVKGIVVDSLGVGETYATLRIYIDTDTVKPVIVGVTDIDGQFQQTIKSAGKYRLNIHSVGKQNIDIPFAVSTSSPIVDLGTIIFFIEKLLSEIKYPCILSTAVDGC